MSRPLTRSVIGSSFLRSFLIQGSWNYRTMLGSGFAFALAPGLTKLFGDDSERLSQSLSRHTEHFNAHPYLASVALGAVLRMEADGADPDAIRRFKTAVRGPLGGLGDTLIWASWLPSVSMAAVALYWLGMSSWIAVSFFIVVYNVGHLSLRVWGFSLGWGGGQEVGRRLAAARLPAWTHRLRAVGVLLLGLLSGAVLGGGGGLAEAGLVWTMLAAAGFLVGLLVGHHVWRPTAIVVVAAIVALGTWGALP